MSFLCSSTLRRVRFDRRFIRRRLLLAVLAFVGFLLLWLSLTLTILFIQDQFFENDEEEAITKPTASNYHLVVGHYNGNLPSEKKKNLTDAQINANNYSPIEGWGENGRAVKLGKTEQAEAAETFAINQFNLYVSDRISIHRSIPDIRKPACRELKYSDDLPTTSVIIVYHNEAYSTLLRTVHSVINQSPRNLLKQIILVDDYSNREFLRRPLDKALQPLPVDIKIVRTRQRVGLIRARMMGAQEATGDVLTFLDSHCECTKGWLEPLLDRIKLNRKAVPCPIIDVINDNTFQYQKGIELFRGGFNWNLQFRWYSLPTNMAKEHFVSPTKPIESPTMAGGLFSIDRKYFEELGEYDPGMDIWGGENLEMSFRIWQCGGRVEILPCSHVGHVFRKSSPHDFPGKSSGSVLNSNLLRVAEVWMDDWKWLFYKIAPQAYHMRSTIDVSERVELRKSLRCKSFQWYLQNVFTDHFLPTPNDRFGRISTTEYKKLNHSNTTCISWALLSSGIKSPATADCQYDKFAKTQLWLLTSDNRLRTDEHLCLSGVESIHNKGQWEVQLKECAGFENEYWTFQSSSQFKHNKSGLCLTIPRKEASLPPNDELKPPTLTKCRWTGRGQRWTFNDVNWLQHS